MEDKCSEDDKDSPGTSKGNKAGSKLGKAKRRTNKMPPSQSEKPVELYRKDLISAMKMADTEHLDAEEYWCLADSWRPEWERGVQVPVGNTEVKEPVYRFVDSGMSHRQYKFKLPPHKFLHAIKDDCYQSSIHELHESDKLADDAGRYDLDELDKCWLCTFNRERKCMGDPPVLEYQMENIMEALETQAYNVLQARIRNQEGLGIEYDESIVCDVCRSPECEDTNEMVFCDGCDVCVHQACYGILNIPDGSWLCKPCSLGVKPNCILCPNSGGALKSSKSGKKWAHVSCALWIPELTFHNPDTMDTVANISQIPPSRWALSCVICREKVGACIQCSIKTCKIAFHVTCAFDNNLDMKTIFLDEMVELKAYCKKHSKNPGESTPKKNTSPKKTNVDGAKEDKTETNENAWKKQRASKLQQLEEEFFDCVDLDVVINTARCDPLVADFVHKYWILKRRANFNRPLITPKTEEADLLIRQREHSLIARMKMFIHLRQDLERVRNLCYMVNRREKLRKQVYNMKEDVFDKQIQVIHGTKLKKKEISTIVQLGRTSIYDHPAFVLASDMKLKQRVAEDLQAQDESDIEIIFTVPATPMPDLTNSKHWQHSLVKRAKRRPKKISGIEKYRASKNMLMGSLENCAPSLPGGPAPVEGQIIPSSVPLLQPRLIDPTQLIPVSKLNKKVKVRTKPQKLHERNPALVSSDWTVVNADSLVSDPIQAPPPIKRKRGRPPKQGKKGQQWDATDCSPANFVTVISQPPGLPNSIVEASQPGVFSTNDVSVTPVLASTTGEQTAVKPRKYRSSAINGATSKKITPRGKSKTEKIEIIGLQKTYKFDKNQLVVPQHVKDKVHARFRLEHVLWKGRVCNHKPGITDYLRCGLKEVAQDQSSTDSYMSEDRLVAGTVLVPLGVDESTDEHIDESPAGRPRRATATRSWLDMWNKSFLYS